MHDLEASFEYCRRLARSRARNFYCSFLLLPPEQKRAMCTLYSFMRHVDDISDETGRPLALRRTAMVNWKNAFAQALQGRYGTDPILPAFHHTVERYRIPHRYFFELFEGINSDLTPQQPQSFDQLYHYCYQVASVVGMACVHIWGYESPEALRLAEKCGVAFQLPTILRDIPEDASMGRIYLPKEDLEKFDVSAEKLLIGRPCKRFKELVEFEWSRADQYYREAKPLLAMVSPSAQPALWTMISIYHTILQRIKEKQYDVFTHHAQLSGFEKMWVVLGALKLRLTSGRMLYPA